MRRNLRSPHLRPGAAVCVKGVFSGSLGNHLGIRTASKPLQSEWSSGGRASQETPLAVALGCQPGQPQENSNSSSSRGNYECIAPCSSNTAETAARSNTSGSLCSKGMQDRRRRRAPQRQASQPACVSGLGCFSSKQPLMGVSDDPTHSSPCNGNGNDSTSNYNYSSNVILHLPQRTCSSRADGSRASGGPRGNDDASQRSATEQSQHESTKNCYFRPYEGDEGGRGDPGTAAATAGTAAAPVAPIEGHALPSVFSASAAGSFIATKDETKRPLLRISPRQIPEGPGIEGLRRKKAGSVEVSRRPLWKEPKQESRQINDAFVDVGKEAYINLEHAKPPQDPPEEVLKHQLSIQGLHGAAGPTCCSNHTSTSGSCSYSSNRGSCTLKMDLCSYDSTSKGNGTSSSNSHHSSSFSVSGITYRLPILDRVSDIYTVSSLHREQLTARRDDAETRPFPRVMRPLAPPPAAMSVEAPRPPIPIGEPGKHHPMTHGDPNAPDTLEVVRVSEGDEGQLLPVRKGRRSSSCSPHISNSAGQCRIYSCTSSSSSGSSVTKCEETSDPLHHRPGGIYGGLVCSGEAKICSSRNNRNSNTNNNTKNSTANSSSSSCLCNPSSGAAPLDPHKPFRGSCSGKMGEAISASDTVVASSLRAADTMGPAASVKEGKCEDMDGEREDITLRKPHTSSSACCVGWRKMQGFRGHGPPRRVAASGVAALRVLSALGAPSGGRQDPVKDDGAESPDCSPNNSDDERSLKKTAAGTRVRTVGTLNGGTSASVASTEDISADLSWLYSVTGIRDSSEANLVDTIELIMDRPLGPKTLSALGTFGCLRQLRLVQQQITSLGFVAACKNLQVLHLPENQIESLEGIQNCKFLEEVDLTGNRIADLSVLAMPPPAQRGALTGTIEGGLQRSPEEQASRGTPQGPLEALQRLHTLRLNSNRLRSLRGLEGLVSLRVLQVADNELTHVGAALTNNRNLEQLNVAANHIWSLHEVTLLSQLPRLESLLFSDVHFLSKQNPICRLKNHEMFALYHLPMLKALNQTVLDAGDSAFVAATYQRKRLYYLLEQQKTRREARDAIKELDKLHGQFRVAIKDNRKFAALVVARGELCGGASFFRWLAAEVRKRREAILSTRRKELDRFGNIHFELGDPSKTWYRRAEDCLMRSFNPQDFFDFGFKSIEIKSVHRIVNREAEAAFDLLRSACAVDSPGEWVLCGANPQNPCGLLGQCTSGMYGDLLSRRSGLHSCPLIVASNGLAEADLPRLYSLTSNESFQAIARQTLELAKASVELPKDTRHSDRPLSMTEDAESQEETAGTFNHSIVQQAVRDGRLGLPDGEVLLCRCLLHESVADTPVGYTHQEIPNLIERGPSKGIIIGSEVEHATENTHDSGLCALALPGPASVYKQRISNPQIKTWWFLEPHCLVPHFLVRFSYSSNSFSSSSRARCNSADSSTTEQTTPQAAAAAGASSTVAAAPGDPPDAARLARQSAVEAEGPQGTKSEAQTQKFDQASHCPIGAPGTCTSTTPASVQHNSSGTGDAVRCAAPFVDLINMARSLLFIHMKELTKRTRTQRPFEAEGYCETVSGACGENVRTEALQRIQGVSTVEEVVFGESHLQQVLLKTFGSPRHAYSLGSLGRQQKAPGEHASSLWEAGDCKAQLDCNGDVLSLSLSSNAHLIALSRGVLLSFQRLRVLLLPLNGLRNFDAPGESPPVSESPSSPTDPVTGAPNGSSRIELPELRVLDLSFNELCTLDGFWGAPRLQQLCLVANHLLLLSDLTPVGTAAPQLRQLWLAGNPLYMGSHSSQQLQQLLPALELLDGRPLQAASAGDPLTCPLKSATAPIPTQVDVAAAAPHYASAIAAPAVATSGLQQPSTTPNEPRCWAIAAAAQVSSMEESQGQRYCTCKAEDAQLLACSLVIPRTGYPGISGASRPLENHDPLPVAMLLPPCRGATQQCCCFCCCCCSCSCSNSHNDALTPRMAVPSVAPPQQPVNSDAAHQTKGCGGLCSVAAAIRTARMCGWRPYNSSKSCWPPSHYSHLPNAGGNHFRLETHVGGPEFSWSNWREKVDILEMSFLRLREAPSIHTLVGLRKLELSENNLSSIQGLLGLHLLEELLLDGNSIESLEGIESLCLLECLDISHNCIVSFPPGMQHLKRLVFLCAESNNLQQLEHLEGLPALTQLYLSSNNIQAFRSLMHLSRCPSLRVLDLRNTPLSMETEYRSYSLYLLPSLRILDGVEPRQDEKEEVKHMFAGRLTRELLEQILGKQLPCLEGSVDLSGHRLRRISDVITEQNFPFLLSINLNQNKITSLASLGTLPLLRELFVANNKIDLAAGGLGGVDGPGLMSLPLLERLDLSFNSLRSLKSLAAAPLGSIRVLQLCGNSLTRVEGLGSCCRLEVLDLSDNRIRRIDPDAFHGAVDTLRCVIMERNGLRSLSGFPFLPNLEELRIAQNRIPDFTHTECLVQLPKLTRIGFQQNPACQRRQWRSVLAEQLPYLQMIDGEIVSVEDIQRKQPGCISEGIPIGEDHGLPLSEAANDETETPLGTQPALDSQTLQQQQPLLLCYSAKPSKNRSVVQPKAEGPAFGPLPKSKPPPAVPELAALNLGVVGVVAPGISPSSGAGSLLSRRDPPSDTSGLQAIAAQKGTRAGSRYLLKVNRCGTSDDRHTPPHGPGWIKGDLCSASVDRYTRSSSTDVCAIIPSWCPPGASLFSSLPHKESIDFNETRAHRGVDISYLGGPLANSSSANTQLPTMLQGLCLHGDRERGQAKGARCNARLKKHKKATG